MVKLLSSGIGACSSWTWWTTTFGSLFNFWNLALTCRGVVRIKGHPGLGRDQEVSLGKPILAPKSSMTIPQRPTDQFRLGLTAIFCTFHRKILKRGLEALATFTGYPAPYCPERIFCQCGQAIEGQVPIRASKSLFTQTFKFSFLI